MDKQCKTSETKKYHDNDFHFLFLNEILYAVLDVRQSYFKATVLQIGKKKRRKKRKKRASEEEQTKRDL